MVCWNIVHLFFNCQKIVDKTDKQELSLPNMSAPSSTSLMSCSLSSANKDVSFTGAVLSNATFSIPVLNKRKRNYNLQSVARYSSFSFQQK